MTTTAAARPAFKRHLNGLEGLRGLAALSVVAYHASVFAPPAKGGFIAAVTAVGWVGVDVFFAISGFILFLPFVRARYGGQPVQLRRYAANRARRILPAYLLNLFAIVSLVAVGLLLHHDGQRRVLASLTFTAGYFNIPPVNGVYWTLFCEVAFYLTLPLLALALVGRRWLVGLPAILVAATAYKGQAIASLASATDHGPLQHALEQFPAVVDQFAMGMAAALLWAAFERRSVAWSRATGVVLTGAGLLGLVGVLYALQSLVGPSAYWAGTSRAGWLPLLTFRPLLSLSASLIVLGVCYRDNAITRFLELAPLRYAGAISFGVYLWHLPLVKTVAAGLPASTHPDRRYAVCLLVTTAVTVVWAAISHHFVEQPFLARKKRPPTLDEDVAASHRPGAATTVDATVARAHVTEPEATPLTTST